MGWIRSCCSLLSGCSFYQLVQYVQYGLDFRWARVLFTFDNKQTVPAIGLDRCFFLHNVPGYIRDARFIGMKFQMPAMKNHSTLQSE